MSNYNQRLDEILSKTPCTQCDGSGAYPDYDGEPVQCQFCWQLRFTFIDKTKQAITSLIKELVEEAKPTNSETQRGSVVVYGDLSERDLNIINQFEQNLLKALEEV